VTADITGAGGGSIDVGQANGDVTVGSAGGGSSMLLIIIGAVVVLVVLGAAVRSSYSGAGAHSVCARGPRVASLSMGLIPVVVLLAMFASVIANSRDAFVDIGVRELSDTKFSSLFLSGKAHYGLLRRSGEASSCWCSRSRWRCRSRWRWLC